jgi:aminopeptidase N
MKQNDTPKAIYLKDYTPPPYWIDTVDLDFDLHETHAEVRARMAFRRNTEQPALDRELLLAGDELELVSVKLDGQPLPASRYRATPDSLMLYDMPDAFTLEIETRIEPQNNTALSGLYKSSGNFCTQCEAEGFRRITYFLDRPDVMARYTTRIEADQTLYPVLLSNGNLVESGELPLNRHYAVWQDPFKKPAYLFALVAGNLVSLDDTYRTQTGRDVQLRIFVEPQNADKVEHAMRSLKHAMQWDEEVFGLEYDLDIYMVVAVNDFNMGAMENKGLNVFNSKYVLARPDTATDTDYEGIEGVIGHEYFHNWTGNRVTCRDWFQLSLKEGLTVFRDQEFTSDMMSRPVKRINDVKLLRTHQFAEDAGPMSHPVRPDSYVEISNFYTVTIYEKGAEVIRMMHTLLGKDNFRRGMDLYFERHDGQAVTCDDFVAAMEDASGIDLAQFRRWYSQSGTPQLHAQGEYDAAGKTYTLTVKQSCPPTPGQPVKKPMHIPLAVGLLDSAGHPLPLQLQGESAAAASDTRVLELRNAVDTFTFVNVPEAPVPSLLRNFSAPVKLAYPYSDTELAFLWAHDTDPFNRWEAGQQYACSVIFRLMDDYRQGRPLHLPAEFTAAFRATLLDPRLDDALKAQALTLPAEAYLSELQIPADPVAIHEVRDFVRRALAETLQEDLLAVYREKAAPVPYSFDAASVGHRSLKNLCLGYLVETGEARFYELAYQQFQDADNMTDEIAALSVLANADCPQRRLALQEFYTRWQAEPLVLDKWFALQATTRLPEALSDVERLMAHEAFDIRNPNKVRSLIGAFAHNNPVRFHVATGEGYRFLADQVIRLDAKNPQIAARLLSALSHWRKYDPRRQQLMRDEIERILATPGLSKDSFEIASKSIASEPTSEG